MAVSFANGNALAEGTRTNSTYTAPTGIADGDLLLLWHCEISAAAGPPAATPPAGWSSVPVSAFTGRADGTWPILANGTVPALDGQYFWYKIASSESGNYTVTHASCVSRGMIARVTGNDTSTPFSPNATQDGNDFATSGATTTFLGLTTTVANQLILCFASDDNDSGGNLTPPTGSTPTFTEQIDDQGGNYLCTGILAAAGATGDKTMANNSTGGVGFFSSMVAVQPATGGPDLNVYKIN